MPLHIDIISDVVCPWCYIGKRRLETALERYAEDNPGAEKPTITWLPFQLNPDLPAEGMSRQDYIIRKFGAARGKDMYARVAGVGTEVGIPFAFDKIVRQPNTAAAHSLIGLALQYGRQNEVKEALMHAYFIDGVDLTNNDNLVAIATAAGLDKTVVEKCLSDPAARAAVQEEDNRARAIGVNGVPFFIFNGKVAISGAHEPETLLDAMRQAETATA